MKLEIKSLAAQFFEEIVDIRKYLHANPELSFNEYNTANFVEEKLKSWGFENIKRLSNTGVVAILGNQHNKTIALRADLDALPINEKNEVNYKSLNQGIMHACGHDVHTASLLGVAKILKTLEENLPVCIKFIFQPGEEKLPGGASLLIKEGVLENPKPEAIIGQHVFPELTAGKVGFRKGIYMASCDEIYITVNGKGGHGAMPHKVIDPVLIASHLVVALQQITSRNANPSTPSVLSIGKFVANGATNVIPDYVKLEGTFRTFDEHWRTDAHHKIIKLCNSICESMGATCSINIERGYPVLYNDEVLTEKLKKEAIEYLGSENVVDLPIRATGEDFAFYSHQTAGCFYRLGTASSNGENAYPVHNSMFNIDHKALETSIGLMAYLALKA